MLDEMKDYMITMFNRIKMLHYHLGPSKEHTVYEAELIGLILGVELLRQESPRSIYMKQVASIAADNKATMQAAPGHSSQPGHYLLDELHSATKALKKKHASVKVTLRWVPGHKGVKGNEIVDEGAKQAARGQTIPNHATPPGLLKKGTLPISVAKLRQEITELLKVKAKKSWQESPRYEKLVNIDASLPSKTYLKLAFALPRKQASLLFQLRTGHVPLNHHLHRIRKVPTSTCPACANHTETVHHFLLMCHAHRKARGVLRKKLGRDGESLAFLLSSPKAMEPLFNFIHATGRLRAVFGNLTIKS
ncbi:hypothetical protein EUX98_g7553 [Antrodiella citrinella]|uniref:RNase H type-1 domain-containing protein n=1 Tax=Antrodiella citrinella TaxID=2447956 RepID=A0A4S4MMY1_9APHY|nr:hypothetical protein EUX98_g7553 [Antrodiella citrinella]